MVTYRVTASSSGVLIMSLSAHLDFQRESQPRLQSALSRDSNVSLYTLKSARSGNGPRHSRWSCDVFRCSCPGPSWMTRQPEARRKAVNLPGNAHTADWTAHAGPKSRSGKSVFFAINRPSTFDHSI